MIRLSTLYPNKAGEKFDMDYYCNKHIPLAKMLFGDAMKGISIDQGISGGHPGTPPDFVAIVNVLFDSIEALQACMEAHATELMADIPNYTSIQPITQINEIKM